MIRCTLKGIARALITPNGLLYPGMRLCVMVLLIERRAKISNFKQKHWVPLGDRL
jgi:hypothetical protein